MSDNNKSYRVKANVQGDSVLNVSLTQDYDILEVLSLKIGTESLYKYHTSNYGCVAGRVLANEGLGIPNAKISIFISATTEDLEDEILSYLYPYTSTSTKNEDKIRYNLLPDEQLSDCHRNVGTFPSKRMVLDDNNVLEIFDKYYKFTTRTNNSGDYMIFGVPVGNQTLHVDIDLSDIGILSQKPSDLIYKGYNITQFENANMFKKSTDLDNLTQIITQNQNVYVYPFWGNESENTIAISRQDIDIQYEFTPTCVFMGSLITDERSNGISKRCIPSERMGKMDKLTTGNGTIEMIRKNIDGTIEETIIQGNQLINGNGVWCYQIPMNLDYVRTDEYGNIVPTDDNKKGVPTRTSVRFRFSLTEFETENGYSHLSKMLVPNNPKDEDFGHFDYVFGTNTEDDSFRDLFWNNVYTVKSYIPRIQMVNLNRNKRFSGFKAVNVNNSNNPIPYNNMRVDLTFMFSLQCAIFKVLLWIVGAVNRVVTLISGQECSNWGEKFIAKGGRCVYIGDGYCQNMEGWYFAPKCTNDSALSNTFKYLIGGEGIEEKEASDSESIDNKNSKGSDEKKCLTNNITYFIQCVELTFAMEYDVIQFDFYNDWINGMIYIPRWFADIHKKRNYLWGLIKVKPKINACMEGAYNGLFARRYVQQCSLTYGLNWNNYTDYTRIITQNGCKEDSTKQRCHKAPGRNFVKLFRNTTPGGGMVHDEYTSSGQYAYYFRPCEWLPNKNKCNLFATDIVLLGSMDENNSQGIPQTFKKLTPTSYQMPDPLASTNLGEEGYVYGEDSGGTLCTQSSGNKGSASVQRLGTSFSAVTAWASGMSDDMMSRKNEDDPYNVVTDSGLGLDVEYAVTESSGIDWGYVGPNQKTTSAKTNNLSTLYFPGGHFLGISCGESEVNIKSCVNLSRICEMGSMISQRQTIIKKKDNTYQYSYLIPTGLISGDEINDYNFKNEFATLNYNGLKTKINPETNLVEYDFETINPINFNGELSYKVTSAPEYNQLDGFNDDESLSTSSNTAYRRTLEENSNDYYKFRLNLHGVYYFTDAQKKYLIVNGYDEVALPMYGNSFYFYFGLKQGNTAIDEFYKNFFAECPKMKEFRASVKITVEDCDACEDNGKIIINVKDIIKPKYCIDNETWNEIKDDKAEITKLKDGQYTILISGENIDYNNYRYERTIKRKEPEVFSKIAFTSTDYTKELSTFDYSEGVGTITFTEEFFEEYGQIVGVIISTPNFKNENNKPYHASLFNLGNTTKSQTYFKGIKKKDYASAPNAPQEVDKTKINGVTIKAWAGNQKYKIVVYYCCNNGGNGIKTKTFEVNISMPKELDMIFGERQVTTYRNTIKAMVEANPSYEKLIHEKWYEIFLSTNPIENSYKEILNAYKEKTGYKDLLLMRCDIAKSLFYRKSIAYFNNLNGSISYKLVGSNTPFTTTIIGCGEKVDTTTKSIELDTSGEKEDFNVSMNNFYLPTFDVNIDMFKYENYKITGGDKFDYQLCVRDTKDETIPFINMPSIYRPFYFRALYIRDLNGNTKAEVAVSNFIGKPIITVNGNSHDLSWKEPYQRRIDPNWPEQYYTTINEQFKLSVLGKYNVIVEDICDKINKQVEVNFLGDSVFGSISKDVIYIAWKNTSDYPSLEYLENAIVTYGNEGKISYTNSKWSDNVKEISNEMTWNGALSSFIRYYYGEESLSEEKLEADTFKITREWMERVYKGKISQEKAEEIITNEAIIVGIYDSNIPIDDMTETKVTYDKGIYDIKLEESVVEPRHENSISILKLYTGQQFIGHLTQEG